MTTINLHVSDEENLTHGNAKTIILNGRPTIHITFVDEDLYLNLTDDDFFPALVRSNNDTIEGLSIDRRELEGYLGLHIYNLDLFNLDFACHEHQKVLIWVKESDIIPFLSQSTRSFDILSLAELNRSRQRSLSPRGRGKAPLRSRSPTLSCAQFNGLAIGGLPSHEGMHGISQPTSCTGRRNIPRVTRYGNELTRGVSSLQIRDGEEEVDDITIAMKKFGHRE
jgi:hypothetical protein